MLSKATIDGIIQKYITQLDAEYIFEHYFVIYPAMDNTPLVRITINKLPANALAKCMDGIYFHVWQDEGGKVNCEKCRILNDRNILKS